MTASQISQNFPKESESGLNELINDGLDMGLMLYSMAYFFERPDIGLNGFSCFINRKVKSGKYMIRKLLNYVNTRGGKVVFTEVKKPGKDEWGTGLEAIRVCVDSFKSFYDRVNQVDQTARTNNDSHLSMFLEKEIMGTLLVNIKLMGSVITDLQRATPSGMGEYEVNKDLHRRYGVFSVRHHNLIEEVLLLDYEGGHHAGGSDKMQAVSELLAVLSTMGSSGSVGSIVSKLV